MSFWSFSDKNFINKNISKKLFINNLLTFLIIDEKFIKLTSSNDGKLLFLVTENFNIKIMTYIDNDF